ncbi:MAG: choline dehydrogenase [Gammaproteobacteria bacterium]|nr:choline dehydrogenase [Gammaproteobacteria bacterium]
MEEFDYIIIGAGSAGCVLADRLSEDGRNSVLVLEHGGSDRSMYIQMPTALSIPMNMPRYNWGFQSEPEPHLGGRRMATPRGKVLGGSSSINGMVYVRGNPLDFERWRDEGASGWSYGEVLPYFRRAERRAAGGNEYRGDSGQLQTCYGTLRNPLHAAWLRAGEQAGYLHSDDVNGAQQEGFGRLDMTVGGGRRCSAANAYLRPAMRRPNLAVRTHAMVTRIEFDGALATGVRYRVAGAERSVQARREVILSAGSIGSPHLLKVSGVGPPDELAAQGIPVVRALPAVGENLQDHLEFYFQVACKEPVTLYSALNPLSQFLIGLRWLLRHDGLGASNHFETGGFIRSRAGIRYANLQFHFLPMAVSYDGSSLAKEHGFQAHIGPMRSQSRGWVRLRSPRIEDPPRIFFNYMSQPEDWEEMRACVRLTREVFAQPAFDRYRGREIQPGDAVQTDAQIDEFIRRKVETAYHPSCSCRMGAADDPRSVVDPRGRVIGVERLRVVDSSIMPSITTGNLNAPTIMIGEKLADAILGRAPPAPSPAPIFQAADWERRQR